MVPGSGAPDPAEERPRAVTVVGWIFLVLSSLRVLEDVIGWVVWKVGDPEPLVRFFLPVGSPEDALALLTLRHFPTVVAVQAVAALGVAAISWSFLRLRPWARPALEIVCWIGVAIVTGIAGFLASQRGGADQRVARGLAHAAFVLLAIDLPFAVAIAILRSPRVRAAFRHPGPASS
jgi:hypothetical protein